MVIFPNRKQVYESKKHFIINKPYSKHNFEYDHQNNLYICPNNEKLEYKKTYNYNNITMNQYYTNKCLNCPKQLECAGKDRYKIITDYGDVLSKRMALKMETETGKIEFAKRKQTVEWPIQKHKRKFKVHRVFNTRNTTNTNRKTT